MSLPPSGGLLASPPRGAEPAGHWLRALARRRWPVALPLAGVLTVLTFSFMRSEPMPALTEKDVVFVADVANSSGDPVFDDTLEQALAVQFQQSPYFRLLSSQRVHTTLQLMQRPPDTRVVGPVAREVCQRAGASVLLAGGIAALGSSYVLTVEAVQCATGDVIVREQEQARRKEDVLDAVESLSARLRERLGESLPSVKRHAAPLEEATTSSLDALKAYGQGVRMRAREGDAKALPFFEQAVGFDPEFALAHARLATMYGNIGNADESRQHAERAFALRDRVSEYERLYIESTYHSRASFDMEKRINALRIMAETYPRDFTAQNNLAVSAMEMGRFDQAETHARAAVDLAPDAPLPRVNLAWIYISTNRFDQAWAIVGEARDRGHTDAVAEAGVTAAWLRGDTAGLNALLEALGRGQDPAMTDGVRARLALAEGRLAEAASLTRAAAQNLSASGKTTMAAKLYLDMAGAEATIGTAARARAWTDLALKVSQTSDTLRSAAALHAWLGDAAGAERLAARIPATAEALQAAGATAALHASIYLARRNPAAALRALQEADASLQGHPDWRIDQARAFEQQGRLTDAAAAYEAYLSARYRAMSTAYPSVRAALARLRARMGHTSAAREGYDALVASWPRADADLPLLITVKRERAALAK